VDPVTERGHIDTTVKVHEELLGHHPSGIYQGKPNENTRRIICEEGKFLYDCDSYADELPYWDHDYGRPHLGEALLLLLAAITTAMAVSIITESLTLTCHHVLSSGPLHPERK
jgi:hypothetical protein